MIERQENKVQYEGGQGTSREFPVRFPVISKDHLRLYIRQDGVETELNSGFTIKGLKEGMVNQGVSVILAHPLAADCLLTIARVVPFTQETVLPTGGEFAARTVEQTLDRLVMQTQQLNEAVTRSLKTDISDPAGVPTVGVILETVDEQVKRASEHADRAGGHAAGARASMEHIQAMKAEAHPLAAEDHPTASYDNERNLLCFGVPKGERGPVGPPGPGGVGAWREDADYAVPSLVFGTDGKLYQALKPSGYSVPDADGQGVVGPRVPETETLYWRSIKEDLNMDHVRAGVLSPEHGGTGAASLEEAREKLGITALASSFEVFEEGGEYVAPSDGAYLFFLRGGGGGGGGGAGIYSGKNGSSGGGGYSKTHPDYLRTGDRLAVRIGAGGAGGAGGADFSAGGRPGGHGGSTEVVLPSQTISVSGGNGGQGGQSSDIPVVDGAGENITPMVPGKGNGGAGGAYVMNRGQAGSPGQPGYVIILRC